MSLIKVYTAVRMTGRYQDEMVQEADMLRRSLNNHGLDCLSPVHEENIPYVHEILRNIPASKLDLFWRRDKEMIRECDVLLDYCTQNQSDGANNEIGYARWCLWKPVVRVWPGSGALISRIEDDTVVSSLLDAINAIKTYWGTYEKLGIWRTEMLNRSMEKWYQYQKGINARYQDPQGGR